jgi:hypothetical protein
MFGALSFHLRPRLALAATVVLLGACGSTPVVPPYDATPGGTKLEPASAAESDLLKRLDALAPNQPTTIAGATVTAEAPYFSASGRTCRWLTVAGGAASPAGRKLACKEGSAVEEEGQSSWFFVPDVFVPAPPAAADTPRASTPAASPAAPAERLAPLPEDD